MASAARSGRRRAPSRRSPRRSLHEPDVFRIALVASISALSCAAKASPDEIGVLQPLVGQRLLQAADFAIFSMSAVIAAFCSAVMPGAAATMRQFCERDVDAGFLQGRRVEALDALVAGDARGARSLPASIWSRTRQSRRCRP